MPAKAPRSAGVDRDEESGDGEPATSGVTDGDARGGPCCRSLRLPVLGVRLPLPVSEHLGFYTVMGALAIADVIDWPVALVVGAAVAVVSKTTRSRR